MGVLRALNLEPLVMTYYVERVKKGYVMKGNFTNTFCVVLKL